MAQTADHMPPAPPRGAGGVPAAPLRGRDPRVDFLRGIALFCIFADHIPNDWLALITLREFGFSDAAEIFVILAGFAAAFAYGRTIDRQGLRAGLAKILRRCLLIYGVQVALLCATVVVVMATSSEHGIRSQIIGPLIRDGLPGTLRGVMLGALPTYLDILPLYIVLLLAFPFVWLSLARRPAATLTIAFMVYTAANVWSWDLPNFVDPNVAQGWYFNPFTWQIVFLAGVVLATWTRDRRSIMTDPPRALVVACWLYLVFAFVVVDGWRIWPAPFGDDFPGKAFPFAFFGNEPKSFVTPWRLAHVLAFIYLVLTSQKPIGVARARAAWPIVACGRQSLAVFATGCMFALFGRIVFRSFGSTLAPQIFVNVLGMAAMLAVGVALERRRAQRSTPSPALRLETTQTT